MWTRQVFVKKLHWHLYLHYFTWWWQGLLSDHQSTEEPSGYRRALETNLRDQGHINLFATLHKLLTTHHIMSRNWYLQGSRANIAPYILWSTIKGKQFSRLKTDGFKRGMFFKAGFRNYTSSKIYQHRATKTIIKIWTYINCPPFFFFWSFNLGYI